MMAYFCTLLQGITLYGGIYYLALLLLSVQTQKPLNVGLVIFPIGCGLVPASTFFGLAISGFSSCDFPPYIYSPGINRYQLNFLF